MEKSQQKVREMMRVMGQDTPETPTIPGKAIRGMRVSTLAEEVGELAQASGVEVRMEWRPGFEKPVVEVYVLDVFDDDCLLGVADALVDIKVFTDGTGVAYGLDLDQFFDEVHRANMSKLWSAEQLILMEPNWYATSVMVTHDNELPPIKEDGRNPVPLRQRFIVKRPDGKFMKPPGFVPPNLTKVLASQNCLHDADVEKLVMDPLPGPERA